MTTPDFVDCLVAQWETELPEERFGALAVMSRLARYLRLANRDIVENLERFGFQESQFNLLCALRRSGEPFQLSPKELATSMLLTSSTMTNLLDQVENAGLVTRERDPRDRRGLLVRLTPEGCRRVEEALSSHLRLCEQLLQPLDDTRRDALADALRSLIVSIDTAGPPVTKHDIASSQDSQTERTLTGEGAR